MANRKLRNKRVEFFVPESYHRKISIFAAYNGYSIGEVMRAIVSDWFTEHPAPKDVTIEDVKKISVLFGEQHYDALDAKAKYDGVPVSAILRAMIRRKLEDVDFEMVVCE